MCVAEQETAMNQPNSQRTIDAYPEHANLYRLILEPYPSKLYQIRREGPGKAKEEIYFERINGAIPVDSKVPYVRRALQRAITIGLKNAGYKISHKYQQAINTQINYLPGEKGLKIYPSFKFRVLSFSGTYYLCLDHQLVVRAELSLAKLLKTDMTLQLNPAQRVLLRLEDGWNEGRLVSSDKDGYHLSLITGDVMILDAKDIYPDLTRSQIVQLAPKMGIQSQSLERNIKQLSFLTIANAPRARLDACTAFAKNLAEMVFPLSEGVTTIQLESNAAVLRPPYFVIGKDLTEPSVAFDHIDQSKHAQNILSGLTTFGAYDKPSGQTRIALLTTLNSRAQMEHLVQRLNQGSVRYPGAHKTFGSEFVVRETIISKSVEDYENGIREFVRAEARKETDVVLAYLPKEGNINSPVHPYYRVKALLLKEGLASQMVDRSTVLNPQYRDLNLALNVYAKAGHTPWVLDEPMPGVDMFIGLSWSQVQHGTARIRMMGYVNVFDSYGRWRFYQGDSEAFAFDERLKHFSALVKNSVAVHLAEHHGILKSVHIHLTKHFSADERAVLAKAVRSAAPLASTVFVSVNPYHILRLYDLTEGRDGQISRSTYLRDEPGRLYLATTGSNIFSQTGMGTPIPLELTVWADPTDSIPTLDQIGQQVLSLTRLNWASTRNFCHEPITTKFAGDIAKEMTAFMEDPSFVVNPSLRGIPWFL